MKGVAVLAIMVAACNAAAAPPFNPPFNPSSGLKGNDVLNAMANSGKFEGDIVLTEEQRDVLNSDEHPSERNAMRDVNNLWPDSKIPYKYKPGVFSAQQKQQINGWLAEFAKVSCVQVVPWSGEKDFVTIIDDPGLCYSSVGRTRGEQTVSLSRGGCLWKPTVIHEFMHAAGFWHEQSRQDRDQYIGVALQNVEASKRHNFNKVTNKNAILIGTYDYQSVMQYRSDAFSKNGRKTMLRKDGSTAELGQPWNGGTFTAGDIAKLKALYKCGTVTPRPSDCINKVGDTYCNSMKPYCNYGNGWKEYFKNMCNKACNYCT